MLQPPTDFESPSVTVQLKDESEEESVTVGDLFMAGAREVYITYKPSNKDDPIIVGSDETIVTKGETGVKVQFTPAIKAVSVTVSVVRPLNPSAQKHNLKLSLHACFRERSMFL